MNSMSGVVVSHRWIAQVFKQRGIPVPGLNVMQSVIVHSNDDTRSKLLAAVTRIEQAIETMETVIWVQALFVSDSPEKLHPPLNRPALPIVISAQDAQPDISSPRLDRPLLAEQHDVVVPCQGLVLPVKRTKHHIYASKAALTIELDTLKKQDGDGDGARTVLIEAAVPAGGHGFDWERKIPFQLMRRELPLVVCGLLGLLDRPIQIKNHGPERNKSLHIEDQGANLYVKVMQWARTIALPVDHADAHAWNSIVLEALQRNAPAVGDYLQLQLLHTVAAMVNRTKPNEKI